MKFTKGLIAGGVIGAMISSKMMQQNTKGQQNQENSSVTNSEYIKETTVLSDDTMI